MPYASDMENNTTTFLRQPKDASLQSATLTTARKISEALGPIPTLFSVPIRALLLDQETSQVMRPSTQLLVSNLLTSPTLKASFYYAALTFHGEKLNNSAYLSSTDLVRIFSPAETASIIGIIFLTMRIQKIGKLREDPDWQEILDRAVICSEIGGQIGYAIPTLGAAHALLVGTLPYIVEGLFFITDINGAKVYHQELRSSEERYNIESEMQLWRCSRFDIIVNLLQMLGFGVPFAHTFLTPFEKTEEDAEDSENYKTLLIDEWIQALFQTGEKPQKVHKGTYYPLERDFHKLMYEVDLIRRNGSKYNWLKRSRHDINPTDTPQLFQEVLQELREPSAIQRFYEENMPKELLETLSEKDLQELSAIDHQFSEE
ncbi:MAG: hypothetical protein ACOX2O_09675 [Bdellovibrionota bacterium]